MLSVNNPEGQIISMSLTCMCYVLMTCERLTVTVVPVVNVRACKVFDPGLSLIGGIV